jgi:hypothetical protein
MPIGRLKLPDDDTLDNMDRLLKGGKRDTQIAVPALTLQYLEALRLDPDSAYERSEIPKSNGKKRIIEAPAAGLKDIQRKILRVLNHAYIPPHVHGFARGRSAYSGLRKMADRVNTNGELNAVFSTDITDFFPSVNREQVKEVVYRYLVKILHRWEKGPHLPTEDVNKLADIITDLCCLHGRLPQGAPTSPVLANLVGTAFDHQIIKAIPTTQTYGRYADDIVIMGLEKLDNKKAKLIRSILRSFGFKTSDKKTSNQSGKPYYNIWGVHVYPKKSREGKETITFKVPGKLVNQWCGEIFAFLDAADVPSTGSDLMADERFQKIMGYLSHAYVVTKYGEPGEYRDDHVLPPKLAHAWMALCKKFKTILPAEHINYFTEEGLEYQQITERVRVSSVIFEERIKAFAERNNMDPASFRKQVDASKKKLLQKIQDDPDEALDIALAGEYWDDLVDPFEDMKEAERKVLMEKLYADLCAYTLLKLKINNKRKTDMTAQEKHIAELEMDKKNQSLLTEELAELWQQFREKLGKNASGHKFLFWNKEKRETYRVVQSKASRKSKTILDLPGFAQEQQ